MQLTLSSRNARVSIDWCRYALLRDSVQHFLEGGKPSLKYRAIHAFERAVDGGRCVIDAIELRREFASAWTGLPNVTLSGAAISIRTRAVLTDSPGLPPVRGTILHETIRWPLPVDVADDRLLKDVLKPLVENVLHLTSQTGPGEQLIVEREGPAPRYAVG